MDLITESPYLQFFIGLSGCQYLRPINSSMMVHFCKRIDPGLIKVCSDITKAKYITMFLDLLAASQEHRSEAEEKELEAIKAELGVRPATLEPGSNWGTLILDATCVPDDILCPVDLRLLNVDGVFYAGVARENPRRILMSYFSSSKAR